MAEEDIKPEQQDAAQEEQAPVFQLVRCFLKDASLEMPHAPEVFLVPPEAQPDVNIQFQVGQKVLGETGLFDVEVRTTVTVKAKDTVLFLVECTQAGVFELRNLPQEAYPHLLNILCPQTIYPYLRANVADLIGRTGMMPVHLPEVNFEAMYQQRLEQEQQQAAGQSAQA